MEYTTDYCFTSMDLFDSKYKKKLGVNMKHVRAYKQDMIKELCSQIFTYFFYLVILDIIENNVTFVIPVTSNKMGRLSVKCYEGKAFQNMGKIALLLHRQIQQRPLVWQTDSKAIDETLRFGFYFIQ